MRKKNKSHIYPWLDFPKNTKPYWIHCSSGEFEYAKPLIRVFKEKDPHCKILVTYHSPSYKKNIETDPLVDMSTPLPWDHPHLMKNFIKHHSPQLLLIARTDLWPEMLYQSKRLHLPTYLFSATLEKYTFLSGFLKSILLKKIDHIFAVSEIDQSNYIKLSHPSKVSCLGDTKYDQAIYRLNHPKKIKEYLKPTKTCIIAGSTWGDDEDVIIKPLINVLKEKRLQLIIAPHEVDPEKIKNIYNQFNNEKLNVLLYTKAQPHSHIENYDVLILDTVGVLAEHYPYAQIAFIGGSFKKKVHSVMEALAAGCVTLIGPYYQNNREAIEFQKHKSSQGQAFVVSVNDQNVFKKELIKLIDSIELSKKHINIELKNKVQSLTGTSTKIYNQIM